MPTHDSWWLYREARDVLARQGSENMAKAYARGAKELRRHPLRVYNKDTLLAITGFGQATVNVLSSSSPLVSIQLAEPLL